MIMFLFELILLDTARIKKKIKIQQYYRRSMWMEILKNMNHETVVKWSQMLIMLIFLVMYIHIYIYTTLWLQYIEHHFCGNPFQVWEIWFPFKIVSTRNVNQCKILTYWHCFCFSLHFFFIVTVAIYSHFYQFTLSEWNCEHFFFFLTTTKIEYIFDTLEEYKWKLPLIHFQFVSKL